MSVRKGALAYESGAELGTQAWVARKNSPAPAAEHFQPVRVREHPWIKPDHVGGLWTSTYDPRHGSGWVQWCLAEEFGCDRSDPRFPIWTLEPEPDARICRIDSYADLEAVVAEYPHRVERSHGWTDIAPHWERLADDFNAVHLTEQGQWATRLTHPLNLYGWDCESTLWLRWAFSGVADLGLVRCDAGDSWSESAA